MNRQGFITKIDGRKVYVAIKPLACCSDGDSQTQCSCFQTGKSVEFRAINAANLPLQTGDYVDVHSSSLRTWWGIARTIGLPLVLFAAAYVFVSSMASSNGLSPTAAGIVGAAIGLIVNFFLIRPSERDFPIVTQILQPPLSEVAITNH